jgi:16S rRNA pseudouridine516 synthase
MRLDKFLSHASGLSRVDSRKAIKAGRVTVDDQLVKRSDHALSAESVVKYDDIEQTLHGCRYFMLHKPAGYVSATIDSEHPTVLDLLSEDRRQLSVAGRLDKDTTGLVLISDDGQWIHRVISPRRQCAKIYLATLDQPINDTIITQFNNGIVLKGETQATLPAQLRTIAGQQVEVSICEGKYHQVKRMFAACGRHVEALHRKQIGSIMLDPKLEPGQYRALTEKEAQSI